MTEIRDYLGLDSHLYTWVLPQAPTFPYPSEHGGAAEVGRCDGMDIRHGVLLVPAHAVREESERLLPVVRQGGYIPSVDHQTPPEASLDDCRMYVRLLREHCEKAAE